eukprot:4697853-Amphidinium_carterae.2
MFVALDPQNPHTVINICCSVVDARLPLLMSRSGLTILGGVLNLADNTLCCTALHGQPCIALHEHGGHLACSLHAIENLTQTPVADPTADVVLPAFLTMVADNVPDDEWPMTQKIRVTPEYLAAEQAVLMHTPRVAYSRTNVASSGTPVRSTALGGYTQRGVGITNATYRHLQLLEALHTIARSREGSMRTPYAAIAVTSGQTPWHTDQNRGATTLTAIGDYTGGQLILQMPNKNTRTFSVKRKWLQFHAHHQHSTGPSEGTRLALSFYIPNFPEKLVPHFPELIKLGFPVEDLMQNVAASVSSSTLAAAVLTDPNQTNAPNCP